LPTLTLLAATPLLGLAHRRTPLHPAIPCFTLPLAVALVEFAISRVNGITSPLLAVTVLQVSLNVLGAYLLAMLLRRLLPLRSRDRAGRPLSYRLFIVLAGVATTLTMGLGIWSAHNLRDRLIRSERADVESLASEVADATAVLLDERTRALAAFGRSLGQLDLATAGPAVASQLSAYVAGQDALLTLLVADNDGQVLAAAATRADLNVTRVLNTNVADRDYFLAVVRNGRPFVSNAFKGRGFGSDRVVAISAPIGAPGGTRQGVIEASLNLSVLSVFLEHANSRHGHLIVLTDGAGHVVASKGGFAPPVGIGFVAPLPAPDKAQPPYGVRDGRDGSIWLAGRAPVGQYGWTVHVLQPASLMLPVFEAQFRTVVKDISIAMASVFVLSLLLASWLARPLRQLSAALASDVDSGSAQILDRVHAESREIRLFALTLVRARKRQGRARRREHQLAVEKDALNEQLRQLLADLDAKVELRTRVLAERESQLRSSEARWRSMAEIAPDAVIVIDEDSRIVFVNSATVRMVGHPAEALIGHGMDVMAPARLRSGHRAGLARYLATGTRKLDWRSAEVPVQHADGREFVVEIAFGEYQLEGRRFFAGYLRDITARKLYERQLTEARDLAESANRAKDAFLATMSHEIRTPLHGLIGTLDLLAREGVAGKAADRLSIARNSARALLQIANDVLDLSGIEVGRVHIERVSFDLRDLVTATVGTFDPAANDKGLMLETQVAADVPGWVEGDPLRLRQILTNLINNALKFTQSGAIKVSVSASGGNVVFDVRDTGVGVPQDKREHIFERFAQADDERSRRYGGAGLGLAISRLLARAMGGDLVLADTGFAGSTFSLRVPLAAASDEDDADASNITRRQRIALHEPMSLRVLVVDDNPANRYVVEAYLQELGAAVVLTDGADAGLAALRRDRFDLVLMDVQMPGRDGYDATREVRDSLRLDLPVIAMTANANIGERARCVAAQMNDLLVKPFSVHELEDVIARNLVRDSQRRPPEPVNAAGQRNDPLLDDEVSRSLISRFATRPGTAQRLYSALQESIETHLGTLRNASGLGALALVPTLHGLKGATGMYGAVRLQHLAASLEDALQRGVPPDQLSAEFSALDEVGRATLGAVRSLLEELASGSYRRGD
jgi:PAS domain S-box-containing protein